MKTIPFLTVALMAVTLSMNTAFAQNRYAAGAGTESVSQAGRPARPERKPLTDEQRIEQRVQKMQRRLLLDEAAAAKFVPLYTEYLRALNDCRKDCPGKKAIASGQPAQKEVLSDDAIRQQLKHRIQIRRLLADTQEKYLDRFSKFLTARQLEMIFSPQEGRDKGKRSQACPDRRAGKPVGCPLPAPHPQQQAGR